MQGEINKLIVPPMCFCKQPLLQQHHANQIKTALYDLKAEMGQESETHLINPATSKQTANPKQSSKNQGALCVLSTLPPLICGTDYRLLAKTC